MGNYRNGAAFELRVKADLESSGYFVLRSAGSHGISDLVAVKRGQALFVQAKRSNPQISPADRADLTGIANFAGGLAIVASMPGRTGIVYRRLTGTGPKDWQPWTADEAEVVTL